MLRLALEDAGFEVDLVSDGETALLAVATQAPAVVIAEIDLPGMTGWQLARALRSLFGRRVRLVALTSRGESEDRDESEAAGFDVHLLKPAGPGAVRETVNQLIGAD